MFTMVLISTNCDKDDDPNVPEGITPADLVGDWEFVSLEFDTTIYYAGSCESSNTKELNEKYNLVTLSLHNVSTDTITLFDDCVDAGGIFQPSFTYILSDNVINCEDTYKFKIVNADTFNGDTLKLELIYPTVPPVLPVGGIYTLNR